MRKILMLLGFSFMLFVSYESFASVGYKKSEKNMHNYTQLPTDWGLNHFKDSLEGLKIGDRVSLGIVGSDFTEAMFKHIKELPDFPSKTSFFNQYERVYRNVILVIDLLRPDLNIDKRMTLKSICEIYYTQAVNKSLVSDSFVGLQNRYGIDIKKISLKEAAMKSLIEYRFADLMGYGVHVMDSVARKHTKAIAVISLTGTVYVASWILF